MDNTFEVLESMTNNELRTVFNKQFSVDEASGYASVLPTLSTIETNDFDRDAMEKYATIY